MPGGAHPPLLTSSEPLTLLVVMTESLGCTEVRCAPLLISHSLYCSCGDYAALDLDHIIARLSLIENASMSIF